MTATADHAASRDGIVGLACLLGGPATGKSTIAAAFRATSARTFTPRAFARECSDHQWAPTGQLATREPIDWDDDTAVDALLRAAFLHGRFAAPGLLAVLDGFPATAGQLRLLHSVAQTCATPLAVVELTTHDLTRMTRCNYRPRVCLACTPDPDGAPHLPAAPTTEQPDLCDRCGSPLAIRAADQPKTFLARCEQYTQARPALREAAANVGVTWHEVDTTPEPAKCVAAVRAALTAVGIPSATRAESPKLPRPR